ncbi:MAG: uncharacterized protein JWP81_1949 [Ferruginibacter sp.]|nr:uncharacterized protein [Ferruginibacter sp.]
MPNAFLRFYTNAKYIMASSFINQIPAIIHLVQKLQPKTILDIGKGFGKYGFLVHEYVGIDNTKKVDPAKTLKEQSNLLIDAIEIDADLMLPHLQQIYNKVYLGDVLKIYEEMVKYEMVLMIDIIEHINKGQALQLLRYLIQQGSTIIIATPIRYFKQELYESEFERHISHWSEQDFKKLGYLSAQYFDAGAVYLLSAEKYNIRGFGNSFIKKIRRIARAISNEL